MPKRGSGAKRESGGRYDFASFRGYRGPRFTPIPDEFLDHQLANVTSAEAKVMLFLFRKTYGYRKSADRVSFAQLERGTMSSEGNVIDRGTGLSKATIWRALKGLERKGLIEVHRQLTPAGDADVNYYRIRELQGRESADDSGGRPPSSGGVGPRRGAKRSSEAARHEPIGLFHSETTAVSKRNDRRFKTERPGGFTTEPTREDSTRQDYTLTSGLPELATQFLQSIGYHKPARTKSERTLKVLSNLAHSEGYDLDDLRAACVIAASMGARGPELIPHVIGKATPSAAEVGERFVRSQEDERKRWEGLSEAFERLPKGRREKLIASARRSNHILAERPANHPLVKAAAIGLLAQESSDRES